MTTPNSLLDEARALYDSGLNVLPASKAKKRPLGTWKQWTKDRPPFDAVFRLGLTFDAICVVCGKTSGGLEIIDFDKQARAFDAWAKLVANRLDSLPVERTQSGGKHVAFRSYSCGRNQKLTNDSNGETLIETRGEGGICLIAPSDGYVLERGDWLNVPTLGTAERDALLEAARSLDETPTVAPKVQAPKPRTRSASLAPAFQDESASDYYKRTNAGKDALLRHGWEFLRDDGKWEQWKRPNQPIVDKPGASWSKDDGFFHVFTSNASPFEPGKSYSHLQVVALLDFDGDLSEASRAVVRVGGTTSSRPRKGAIVELVDPDGWNEEWEHVPPVPQERKGAPSRAVPFPSELLNCGGRIGTIQGFMNDLAIRPQPEGAFLGALACVSFLCGRSIALNYNGTLVTPNLYALFLAPTGMGKEAIRRVASEIIKVYNPEEPAPESFASVQALQNFVSRVKKVLWLHDEFGRDLRVMSQEKSNSNIQAVITESLKLYSNAGNRSYLPKVVSQEAKDSKKIAAVDRPFLSIFATGNPSEYYEATNESLLKNGYIARFTTVLGRKYSEKKSLTFEEATASAPFELDSDFVKEIESWKAFENSAKEAPFIVSFRRRAFDLINAFGEETEKKIKQESATREAAAGAYARYFEKVWKYALLFAASERGAISTMEVDEDAARLATLLVDYESRVFSATVDKYATNEQSRLALDVREWAESIGGTFTRTQFTRKFQHKANIHERKEALDTLLESEYLIEDRERKLFYINE